jgi:hypothetical protein
MSDVVAFEIESWEGPVGPVSESGTIEDHEPVRVSVSISHRAVGKSVTVTSWRHDDDEAARLRRWLPARVLGDAHRRSPIDDSADPPIARLVEAAMTDELEWQEVTISLAGTAVVFELTVLGAKRWVAIGQGESIDVGIEADGVAPGGFRLVAYHEPLGPMRPASDRPSLGHLAVTSAEVVADVVADLTAPLDALSLLVETLEAEGDPHVVARLAARVAAEAERLDRIVDDLVEFSAIKPAGTARSDDQTLPVDLVYGDARLVGTVGTSPVDVELDLPAHAGQASGNFAGNLLNVMWNLGDNYFAHPDVPGALRGSFASEPVTLDATFHLDADYAIEGATVSGRYAGWPINARLTGFSAHEVVITGRLGHSPITVFASIGSATFRNGTSGAKVRGVIGAHAVRLDAIADGTTNTATVTGDYAGPLALLATIVATILYFI